MPNRERERLYAGFRDGSVPVLVASKVANFSLDLPEANVLIQVSGSFGSRQEEAQRLGRILRPKAGGARFYTLVTKETVEQEFALHRQLFLAEQGYRYRVEDWAPDEDELEEPGDVAPPAQRPASAKGSARTGRRSQAPGRGGRRGAEDVPGELEHGDPLPDNVIRFPIERVRRS
jgi:DNA excision repair protein ERCC-3